MTKKRNLVLVLCLVLVTALVSVGGTLAWLMDETEPVVNTFTVGTIDIELDESDDLDLKMIPGKTITKDPVVTVKEGSEASWLFVKVEKANDFDTYMTYEIADGWTELTEGSGIYYREVDATTDDTDFSVLKDDTVKVKDTVTKEQLDAIKAGTVKAPTLTFTAYAVQRDDENVKTAAAAWAIAIAE